MNIVIFIFIFLFMNQYLQFIFINIVNFARLHTARIADIKQENSQGAKNC